MQKILLSTLVVLMSAGAVMAQLSPLDRQYVIDHLDDWQLELSDIESIELKRSFTTAHNQVTHNYYQQTYLGKPIYAAIYNTAIQEGKVLHVGNRLVNRLAAKMIPPKRTKMLSANEAIQAVGADLGYKNIPLSTAIQSRNKHDKLVVELPDYSRQPLTVTEMWFPIDSDNYRLAYQVEWDAKNGIDYWNIYMDAASGSILRKQSYTVHCSHASIGHHDCSADILLNQEEESSTATSGYRVFVPPIESPIHGAREMSTVDPSDASPFGWHDTNGSVGAEYTITRGNNVHAFLDLEDDFEPSEPEPDGGSSLLFDFAYDRNDEPEDYRAAAITNNFYMTNYMHDFAYKFGFTEAAGNFQQTNYGGSGEAEDYVISSAQNGGGSNNANFTTPADGYNGFMRMYLWTGRDRYHAYVKGPSDLEGFVLSSASYQSDWGEVIDETPEDYTIEEVIDQSTNSRLGCTAIDQDLKGKMAFLIRGNCDFSLKAYNAQEAGASAVCICNYAENIRSLGAGDMADEVTIPVIMMTFSDCSKLLKRKDEVIVSLERKMGTGPEALDSDFDNGIIAHEYGHGISNRLTGGADDSYCLSNDEQMGEGWSDFFTLVTMVKDINDRDKPRTIGTYPTFQEVDGDGIRTQPYSIDPAINNLTYDDILQTSSPHALGEVWTACLWDLYWAMVDKYGFDPDLSNTSSGNFRAIQLVMDGMMNQPCEPGFVDGRSALMSADIMNNKGENVCLLWNVFSARGLGYNAEQLSSDDRNDGISNFTTPRLCMNNITIEKFMTPYVDKDAIIDVEIIISNNTGDTINDLVVNDYIPDGTTFNIGSSNINNTYNSQQIIWRIPELNRFTQLKITYQLIAGDVPSSRIFFDDVEQGNTIWTVEQLAGINTSWSDNRTGVFAPAHEGKHAWFVNALQSEEVALAALSNSDNTFIIPEEHPVLHFYTYYDTEANADAGRVRIRALGTTDWEEVDDRIIRGKYRGRIATTTFYDSNLYGFWGRLNKDRTYTPIAIDLTGYEGEELEVQFLFGTDADDVSIGWGLDNIEIMDLVQYNTQVCMTASNVPSICAWAEDGGTFVNSEIISSTHFPELNITARLAPNPASSSTILQIQADEAAEWTIQIVNLAGQLKFAQDIRVPAGDYTLPIAVENWSSGVYFVQIIGEDGYATQKLIIQ